MKRGTIIASATALAAVIGLTAVATTSFAHGPVGDRAGMGTHGQTGMHQGMMGGHRARMLQMLDTNGDGAVGGDEARSAMLEQLKSFDADGDGALSLEEFATMHAVHTRPMTVDRFQFHDDDGDGKVTAEEMTAPFAMMMRRMDKNGDGKISDDDMRGHHPGGSMMKRN